MTIHGSYWRGRKLNSETMVWEFQDGSGTPIADEIKQEIEEGLFTLQQDNMNYARRLFHPSQFEDRKK